MGVVNLNYLRIGLLLILAGGMPLHAATPGGSGGGNAITTDVPDAGGQTSSGGTLSANNSLAPTVTGISTGGNIEIRHGFIGQLFEAAPQFVSGGGITANPTTGVVGQAIAFSINATDEDPFTISWDFGDGQTDTTNSASVSHTYSAAGTFTITVTLNDPDGLSNASTLTLDVIPDIDPNDIDGDGIPNDADADADNDGVGDELETALGTDPLDANSSPVPAAVAASPEALTITKMRIKLRFDKDGTDKILLSGALDIPDDFDPTGVRLAFDIGGITRIFTLDAKGKQKLGFDAIKLRIKKTKKVVLAQAALLKLKISRGTFRDFLVDEDLTGAATVKLVPRTVVVTLILPDAPARMLQKAQPQQYSAKEGKLGKTL